MGYYRNAEEMPLAEGHVRPAPWPHAAIEDLLALVMDICHERGGVLKCHGVPPELEQHTPVYDYLWVGEGAQDLDRLRRESRLREPYVSPCPDMSRAQVVDEHEFYLHSIPYLQFPLRVDGRPCTGERGFVEGLSYQPLEKCFWTRHCHAIWEWYREHPDGPFAYGLWDSAEGRPDAREVWLEYLDLYLPMARKGGQAWLEIRDGSLFTEPVPEDLTASLFVNTETYLVLANYGDASRTLTSCWEWQDRRGTRRGRQWTIEPGKLLLLERVADA